MAKGYGIGESRWRRPDSGCYTAGDDGDICTKIKRTTVIYELIELKVFEVR